MTIIISNGISRSECLLVLKEKLSTFLMIRQMKGLTCSYLLVSDYCMISSLLNSVKKKINSGVIKRYEALLKKLRK